MERRLQRDFVVVQALGVQRTLVPLAQPPKKFTVPPLRTMSMDHSHASGRPTASITTSQPRPSGRQFAHRLHRIVHLA